MIRREFAALLGSVVAGFARGTNRTDTVAPQKPVLELPYIQEEITPGPAFSIRNGETELTEREGHPIGIQGLGLCGVDGDATRFAGGKGVFGRARGKNSVGVDGRSDVGIGVIGDGRTGMRGVTSSRDGFAVEGAFLPGAGEYTAFRSTRETGGFVTHGMLGTPVNGVEGVSDAVNGKGVAGRAEKGGAAVAVYGQSVAGLAGFFRGRVTVTESLLINKIFADSITGHQKLFRIDHPLEPSTRTLAHASIESDSMKNLYDGVAILDAAGMAWVILPDWFEALNTEFRYQLTCIGTHAPLYIAREIHDNRFQIAGGRPGMKVSWQVTGLRHDAYAKAHPLQVEEDKDPSERGRYWAPREHGAGDEAGILTRGVEDVAPLEE